MATQREMWGPKKWLRCKLTSLQVDAQRIDDTLGTLQCEALLDNLTNTQECEKTRHSATEKSMLRPRN